MILTQKLIIVVIVLFVLGGCSRQYQPLAAGKKAKLVAEMINNAPRCNAFKTRLALPSMDDDGIDEVWHDAMQAQCINKDI